VLQLRPSLRCLLLTDIPGRKPHRAQRSLAMEANSALRAGVTGLKSAIVDGLV